MAQKVNVTSKQFFLSMVVINIVLAFSQVMLSFVVFFIHSQNENPVPVVIISNTIAISAGMLLMTFGILMSRLVFTKRLEKLKQEPTLQQKMRKFNSTVIIGYALMEFPGLICIAFSFITCNTILLIFPIVVAVALIYYRPTKRFVQENLNLSLDDLKIIDDPNAVLYQAYRNNRD